ncbi:MAG: hypothetical protein ACI9WT_000544 [Flavobacterium sp.]|jgi:hypothetical protein
MEINLESTCQTSEIITGKKNSIKDPLYRKDYIFNIYAVESLNTKKKFYCLGIFKLYFGNKSNGVNSSLAGSYRILVSQRLIKKL